MLARSCRKPLCHKGSMPPITKKPEKCLTTVTAHASFMGVGRTADHYQGRMRMNLKELNATIDSTGVRVTRADRDTLARVKGAPAPDTDREAAWCAIVALVRVGVASHVADRMATWGDTDSIHPAHVADILTNDPRTPHVVVDASHLTNVTPDRWTDKNTRDLPTTLNNLFRLHTRTGGAHAPRLGDRIGAGCRVSWVRVDGTRFAFIANG